MQVPVEIQLIGIAELCAITKRSRASAYRDMRRDKDFPRPFRLPGGRSVRWRLLDVMAYISKKSAASSTADNGGAQ